MNWSGNFREVLAREIRENKTLAKITAYTVHSTLTDCYILKYLLLNLVQNHPGLRDDFGHPNIYMVFQSKTASKIQNGIVCDLFLTQTAHLYLWMWDLIVLFPPILDSWPPQNWLILVYFRKLHENHTRQHILQAIYSHLLCWYIASKDHMKIFLEN